MQKEVETILFRAFAFAVANKASDIHITGRDIGKGREVLINIQHKTGFSLYKYNGKYGDHFKEKLFNLCNLSSGAYSPIISSRFSMSYPLWWAEQQGLKSDDDQYLIDVRLQFQETNRKDFTFVCRILDSQRAPKLHELNLPSSIYSEIVTAISQSSGLILVSGPTGSGKSTLLNAMLMHLNDGTKSIVTIEDPVEYTLKGTAPITQVGVNSDMSFAQILRSAMRMKPDVILIGEIRDQETMDVALAAAETGHFVISTVHSDDSTGTIMRALNLCKDPANDAPRLASKLRLVISQHLPKEYEATTAIRQLTLHERHWMEMNGICPPERFVETTSKVAIGRTPIIEVMNIDYPIMTEIAKPNFRPEEVFKHASQQLQFETQMCAGMRAVETGKIPLESCAKDLHRTPFAHVHKNLRTLMVEKYKVSYTTVGKAVDHIYTLKESNIDKTLDEVLTEWTLLGMPPSDTKAANEQEIFNEQAPLLQVVA